VSANTLVAQRFAWTGEQPGKEAAGVAVRRDTTNFAELTKRVLLQSFAPPSVITDNNGDIVYVHGDTGKYLQTAQGQPSTNVIDMAREGLQMELRTAIQNAAVQKKPAVVKNLPVRTNGGIHGVDLTVRLLADPGATRELLLISFQDTELQPKEKRKSAKRVTGKGESTRVAELEQELAYAKESLNATIEEMQATNEELKSTNEEHQSTNEELQSSNEELDTSKEELQSVNEEIVTVNAELQAKIVILTDIQNDMKNLLENVNMGTIFLDGHLAIKRFTRDALRVFRLAPSDTGRPLADIRSLIPDVDLIPDVQGVLDSLIPWEIQVRTTNNEWFLVRIMPYRTLDNVIDGVVLTFSDITALKTVEEALLKNTVELQASNEKLTAVDKELRQTIDQLGKTELALRNISKYNRSLLEASLDPLVTIDEEGRIADVNPSTEKITGYSREELIGTDFVHYFTETAKAKRVYQQAFTEGTVRDYPLSIRHRDGHITPVLYNAAVYRDETGKVSGIFAAARDISERKKTEELLFKKNEEVRLARDYAENIIDTIREPLLVLNSKFEVISASRSFYTIFQVKPEATQGKVLYELGNNQWDIPRLHVLLETVLPKNRSFDNFEVEHNFPGIGQKKMLLNAREIIGQGGVPHLILLAMEVIAPVGDKEERDKPGTRDGMGA
jgi:PAS domain S-box-containing protein